ncbi:MAG: DUF2934 domain-containing protein [Anaerolineae bacterium]
MSAAPKSADKHTAGNNASHPENEDLRAKVAEAAYYLAERRGFCPGCELDDWLAAEAQVLGRLKDA